MSQNDITSTRLAIGQLAKSKHLRRYPGALRARLAALLAAHPEHSTASLARELDMRPRRSSGSWPPQRRSFPSSS